MDCLKGGSESGAMISSDRARPKALWVGMRSEAPKSVACLVMHSSAVSTDIIGE